MSLSHSDVRCRGLPLNCKFDSLLYKQHDFQTSASGEICSKFSTFYFKQLILCMSNYCIGPFGEWMTYFTVPPTLTANWSSPVSEEWKGVLSTLSGPATGFAFLQPCYTPWLRSYFKLPLVSLPVRHLLSMCFMCLRVSLRLDACLYRGNFEKMKLILTGLLLLEWMCYSLLVFSWKLANVMRT
jgi:hypothetical protein